MFGYSLIIERIWSNNIFLPKASIIKYKAGNKYYSTDTNRFKNYTYRFMFKIIKTKNIKKK